VVDPQWYLRFHVGPSNAFHIYQISTDEHRGRESRKKIPINVPLHGSVRRPKVVPGGCDFHVSHDWLLMHVIPPPLQLFSARSRHHGKIGKSIFLD